MEPRFFGLTPNDKEIFLEQIWTLMYYIGFTYTEAYRLPIWQRIWFIQRTNQEFKQSSERNDGHAETRAAHTNSPEQRVLSGKARPFAPARNRRFT